MSLSNIDSMSFGMHNYKQKVNFSNQTNRFLTKIISTQEDLRNAFSLRYQVFYNEMNGIGHIHSLDIDEYDLHCDHLAIFDCETNQIIATCRLNCSLFSNSFYSENEFECTQFTQSDDIKVELGRVCVHPKFRNSIVIYFIWKSIAEYMKKTNARFLFGCSSIMTQDPQKAFAIYEYLLEKNYMKLNPGIFPKINFFSQQLQEMITSKTEPLKSAEMETAKHLVPPLMKSYFDMGSYTPCIPAFDTHLNCIDFLTILDIENLNSRLLRKVRSCANG